LYLDSWY